MIFPVIALKKKRIELYVFTEENKLNVTSEELLYQQKVFDGVEFIDSAGKMYKILSIKKTGWATALLGYSLTRKGRLIKIEFELQDTGQVDLEDFKKLVIDWGRKKHPFFREIEDAVLKANSYSEVIKRIA